MSEASQSSGPKWIPLATAVLGLLAALMLVLVRYYEIEKAKTEADHARIKSGNVSQQAPNGSQPSAASTTSAGVPGLWDSLSYKTLLILGAPLSVLGMFGASHFHRDDASNDDIVAPCFIAGCIGIALLVVWILLNFG